MDTGSGGGWTRYVGASEVERGASPGTADRGASLGVAGAASCDSLNCVNFALLASCFRACAAAVSKVNRVPLGSGPVLRVGCVVLTPLSLPEVEEKVWPAPEL